MTIPLPFRQHHLYTFLEAYDKDTRPLDACLHAYFRHHKALGSKDRGFIAETVYALIRWLSLLDYLSDEPHSWEKRVEVLQGLDVEQTLQREDIPLHIRLSCPKGLFDRLVGEYGLEKGSEICRVNNTPAPTTIRVNTLKITREALLDRWKGRYVIRPTTDSPEGITFINRANFFEIPEFKEGLFEVQDEGSQLLAAHVKPKSGDLVIDYCSGSGGKTLAFAPQLQGSGQIYLHDIRPHALQEARIRLRRAGIQNAQVILPDSPQLARLKKKMQWVLIDAPCSGSGTLRRNPDMKWKLDDETITRLVGQQRTIFEKGLSYMHPEGRIVYGTCSLFREENQDQMDHFIRTYGLCIEGQPFQSLPTVGGMDGFFGVVLKKA